MSVKSNAYWEPIRALGFGAIGGAYAPLGTPFTNVSRNIKINNTTDALLIFSTDGVTDMFVLPTMSGGVWDIAACRAATSEDCGLKIGTQIYVTGIPTLGAVYLETIYIG